ncbi:MAG: hypothetical protein GYB64_07810 [Chloroflexi bacterium]|nr:hypothetical protein [Chloroflexota bacterium]
MTAVPPYEAEIRELHDFFAAWFNGTLNETRFVRFTDVLAMDFTMITPDARAVRARDDVLDDVRGGYASRTGMRIWIEDVRLLHTIGEVLVVSYIEKQAVDDRETARRSTVLFAPQDDTPNGLLWLHVHETWIEG